MSTPLDLDLLDLDSLRLPPEMVGDLKPKNRLPRHQPRDPFIKGPIPYAWISSACRLAGVGLHVAMAYRLLVKRFALPNGRHWGVSNLAKGLRVSKASVRRGLSAAEMAGLLSVVRNPSCKSQVAILEIPEPENGRKRRPLYGPIPWAWWFPACRLPGRSLQVAAICWLLAGWERSAEFKLALGKWGEFGLSRDSASRGLVELERVKLISVVRAAGRSPVVTIMNPSN
jgi:hypothetical protein